MSVSVNRLVLGLIRKLRHKPALKFKMASLEKYFLFALNILTFFVYGTSLSAFGISLQEYQRNIHMNIRELSFGVSLSAVFGCVSCLLGNYEFINYEIH